MTVLLRHFVASLLLALFVVLQGNPQPLSAAEIAFPGPHPTLQAAVEAAAPGDTVVIAAGVHRNVSLTLNKAITLRGADAKTTILDGGGTGKSSRPVVSIPAGVTGVRLSGLTFRNGPHGVLNAGEVEITDCVITGNTDGLSFENGRGTIRRCVFEKNRDDGIDFDDASQGLIEDSHLRDNGDDGIEIRLHKLKKDYAGGPLVITLRRNVISGNGEDGIQLIDYEGKSPRTIRIERNVFFGNKMVDLGCMPDGDTKEKFTGAALLEPVLVIHNTFAGGQYAVTGGDNLLLLNNVITGYRKVALKCIHGDSAAGPNLLWNNGRDLEDCDLDTTAFVFADPRLDKNHAPQPGSAALDKAVLSFDFHGDEITPEPIRHTDAVPDLGAKESGPARP